MKVIFLDRDGVINRDPGGGDYVKSWEEFSFLPGALEAIKRLTVAGYEIVIISNQAGVGKGLFSKESLDELTQNMIAEIENRGGRIRSVHYCLHRNEENCDCRKPNTGLFKQALSLLYPKIETLPPFSPRPYFIGDGVMDIEAGYRMGYKTVLLLCGKTRLEQVAEWAVKPDYIKNDLLETVGWILER